MLYPKAQRGTPVQIWALQLLIIIWPGLICTHNCGKFSGQNWYARTIATKSDMPAHSKQTILIWEDVWVGVDSIPWVRFRFIPTNWSDVNPSWNYNLITHMNLVQTHWIYMNPSWNYNFIYQDTNSGMPRLEDNRLPDNWRSAGCCWWSGGKTATRYASCGRRASG